MEEKINLYYLKKTKQYDTMTVYNYEATGFFDKSFSPRPRSISTTIIHGCFIGRYASKIDIPLQ